MTRQPTSAPVGIGGRRFIFLAAMAILATALATSFSGCTIKKSAVQRVVDAINGETFSLTQQDLDALKRFDKQLDKAMAKSTPHERSKAESLFRDVYVRVRAGYVHKIDGDALVDASLKGLEEPAKPSPANGKVAPPVERALDAMMASLDPHSAYYNPQEYRESRISTRGEFGGLGITVAMEKDAVKVIAPIKDTPAWRAGLKADDRIVAIDGKTVAGMRLMTAVHLMRGAPGTDVTLTIKRGDMKPFDVTLTRAVITVKAVTWRMEGRWAYIKVSQFNQTVSETFADAMEGIDVANGQPPAGIVLDLRGNRGGLLNQSVALADAFLPSGVIVSSRGRRPDANQVFKAEYGDLAETVPTVVLIDGGTASAAEIVTAALKENHRAIVMGTQSFGKGSVQTILPLANDGAVKITTAIYYGPTGHAIQAHGITPNIRFIGPTIKAEERKEKGESSLPGAFPAVDKYKETADGRMNPKKCPGAGDDGKDHELGCALELLRLGSEARFLAEYGQRVAGTQ